MTMDRTRRGGAGKTPARGSPAEPAPARSRLVTRPGANRRRAPTAPRISRRAIANACGRALRRSVPVVAVTAVIALVAFGAYAGYRYLATSPRFSIAAIEIRGNHTLTTDEVLGLLTARVGDNVFTADVHAEAAALRAEPWILRAEVRRQLPGTLVVEIEERTAAAVVALDALYYADAGGVPFRRCDEDYAADLPLVTGLSREAFATGATTGPAAVTTAIATIAAWRAGAARPPADEIHLDGHGGLALRTHDGVSIQLGTDPDGIAGRLRRFDLAWGVLDAKQRARTRAIHLDHETRQDHVIVAFKD